jgi:hypothetical protein
VSTSTHLVHALFGQRVAGDDALLKLAKLRFTQAGLAAELYADTAEQLGHLLEYVPRHQNSPVVHLHRGLNVLHERDRAAVGHFAARFAGQVSGLVVHDHAEMGNQTDALVDAMHQLDSSLAQLPGAPAVFLEYAAGLEPDWFLDVAQRLGDARHVSVCVDVGHIGIRRACASFARSHPALRLESMTVADRRLPDLAADVEHAVASALPEVLALTQALGRLGKRLHFHLHDGHPLVPGLSDHFSFLTRLPVPFTYAGRQSLSTLYGPGGLAAIVAAAVGACDPGKLSLTLEIHQVEGRLPLGDAAPLFQHWQDTANAERANYWLAVMAQNALLAEQSILQSASRAG